MSANEELLAMLVEQNRKLIELAEKQERQSAAFQVMRDLSKSTGDFDGEGTEAEAEA